MLPTFIFALATIGVSALLQAPTKDRAAVGFSLYGFGTEIGGFALTRVNDNVYLNKTAATTSQLFTIDTMATSVHDAKSGDTLAIPTKPGPITFVAKTSGSSSSVQTKGMRLFENTPFFVDASGQLQTAWTAVPVAGNAEVFELNWNVTSTGAVPLTIRTIPPGPSTGAVSPGTNATATVPATAT